VWREQFPLGEARPLTHDYRGLRSPGHLFSGCSSGYFPAKVPKENSIWDWARKKSKTFGARPLAGLMQVKPEGKENLMAKFKYGDRVIISQKASTTSKATRGKQGVIMEVWERLRVQEDEPRYFSYVVQLDKTERKVEVDEYDLLPA
jgi:hypothetical protein